MEQVYGENFRIILKANPEYGAKPELEVTFLNDCPFAASLSDALVRRICHYWSRIPDCANLPLGTGFMVQGVLDAMKLTFYLPDAKFQFPQLVADSVLRLIFEELEKVCLMPCRAGVYLQYLDSSQRQEPEEEFEYLRNYAVILLPYLMAARRRIFSRASIYYQLILFSSSQVERDYFMYYVEHQDT